MAHEAHHRGQIVLVARQTGHRLPRAIIDGLWWWRTDATRLRGAAKASSLRAIHFTERLLTKAREKLP